MQTKIKVAVLGVGSLGKEHARIYAELAAAGKPSILVPFPYAADNHQTRNAQAMERGGASRLVRDAEMTGQMLFETVRRILADLARMGEAARQFAKPGAARRAADVLEEVART